MDALAVALAAALAQAMVDGTSSSRARSRSRSRGRVFLDHSPAQVLAWQSRPELRGQSSGPQLRPVGSSAKLVADILRLVYSRGMLHMDAGPWCYNVVVRESAFIHSPLGAVPAPIIPATCCQEFWGTTLSTRVIISFSDITS